MNIKEKFLKEIIELTNNEEFDSGVTSRVHPGHIVLYRKLLMIEEELLSKNSMTNCLFATDRSSQDHLGMLSVPRVSLGAPVVHNKIRSELKDIINGKGIEELFIFDPFMSDNNRDEGKKEKTEAFITELDKEFSPDRINICSKSLLDKDFCKKLNNVYHKADEDWHDRCIIVKVSKNNFKGISTGHSIAELGGTKGYVTSVIKEDDCMDLFHSLYGGLRKL